MLILIFGGFILTAHNSLSEQGITSGFGFLERGTGWDMGFAFLPTSISDPYWYTLLMGFLNTVIVGYVAMAFATFIGVGLAGMRISSNPVLNMTALIYVDLIRNIPPILQVLAWYGLFSTFPAPRQAFQFGESVFISARGVYMPALNISGYATVAIAVIIMVAIGLTLWVGFGKRFTFVSVLRKTAFAGQIVAGAAALIALHCIAFRIPDTGLLSFPELKGFNFRGGMSLTPELLTILVATMIYGSAYVAEIVRGGILSVDPGKVEAGRALGMSSWMIFSRIQLPITVQNILPMMTNLYVWLIKATTLGIAVGFSDMFAVSVSSINQSGQTIEFILILAASFWILNNGLVWILNGFGARIHRKQAR
uniref:ABC transporter permease subunit n=1 Tax=Pararhizobium sp. IMCC3301 TaxID=3067904 RepID=UPI00274143F7|nr:ABC transporter permease subunit [Pararhizobium sp. IMCC3301]